MAKDKPHHEQSEQNPNDAVPSYGERCLHYKLLQVDEVESQSDLHSEAGQARAGCQEPGSENCDEYEKNDETSNRIEVGQKERYGEGGTVCPEVISQIAAVTTGRTNHRRACSSLPLLVSISLCAYIFFCGYRLFRRRVHKRGKLVVEVEVSSCSPGDQPCAATEGQILDCPLNKN